MSFLSQ